MNRHPILCATLAASLFLMGGCDGSRTTDYPNNTPDATRRVDDVKRNAREQKDALDRSFDEASQNLDFRERQIRERYKADRATMMVEVDKENGVRAQKRRDIETKAKFEKDKIDADLAGRVVSAPADEAAQMRAEAASKKAAVDSETAKQLAPIMSENEKYEVQTRQRKADLDLKETNDISELEKERSKAREQLRLKRIEVDRWTTDELGKINKDTAPKK